MVSLVVKENLLKISQNMKMIVVAYKQVAYKKTKCYTNRLFPINSHYWFAILDYIKKHVKKSKR